MLKHASLTGFVALLLSLFVFGQEPTVSLGGIDLTLGMPKEVVLSKLKRYEVSKIKNWKPEDSWAVFGKEGSQVRGFGSISFVDGKLSSVQKQWGPFEGELGGARLISALSQILATAQKKGGYTTTIDAQRNPGRPGRSALVRIILSDIHNEGDKPVRKVLQLFAAEETSGVAYGLIELVELDTKQTANLMKPTPRDSN